jgi:hypothetical protein
MAGSAPVAGNPSARLVVRIDAVFEAVLAGCCAVLALASPREGVWRLPSYLTAVAVAAVAAILVVVAGLLWLRSRRPTHQLLVLLGAGNAVTALVTVWYAVTVSAGSGIGLLLGGTALVLTALATCQAVLALGIGSAGSAGLAQRRD